MLIGLAAVSAGVAAAVAVLVFAAFHAGRYAERTGFSLGKRKAAKPERRPDAEKAAAAESERATSRQREEIRNFFLYDGTERPIPGTAERKNETERKG